jgi:hypothetical protein
MPRCPTVPSGLGLCPSNPIGAAPGTPCNIYEYDSLAVFKENQIFLNLNVAYGRKLTFTGFYIYSKANSDTGGPGYHPSNQYDIMQDYGRQFFDVRNRVFAFANYSAPYGFRISPFLSASSGAPFNIQLSQDNQWGFVLQRSAGLRLLGFQSGQRGYDEVREFRHQRHSSSRLEADPHQLWEWPGSIRHEYARGQELWRRPAGGRRQGSEGCRGGGGGRGGRGMPGWGWAEPGPTLAARTTAWIVVTASP